MPAGNTKTRTFTVHYEVTGTATQITSDNAKEAERIIREGVERWLRHYGWSRVRAFAEEEKR